MRPRFWVKQQWVNVRTTSDFEPHVTNHTFRIQNSFYRLKVLLTSDLNFLLPVHNTIPTLECIPLQFNGYYMYVAFVIQLPKCMRRVSSVVCLAPPYVCTLSHKQHDFRGEGGGKLLNIKCVLIFCTIYLKQF